LFVREDTLIEETAMSESGISHEPSVPPVVQAWGAVLRHELSALRGNWVWFLILGISLVVLGTVAIGSAVFVTFATVIFFGALLMTGGIIEVLGSFWTRNWSGFFLHLLSGVLSIVIGLFFLRHTGEASLAMTLLLAAFLLAGGAFKIVGALTYRFASWGWVVLSGVIDVLLGGMIWAEWPLSGLWVIGLFVGINLILRGWNWVILALGLRALPRAIP
jgi:uncharacterized membrane protein HdeD (DUF308 family)